MIAASITDIVLDIMSRSLMVKATAHQVDDGRGFGVDEHAEHALPGSRKGGLHKMHPAHHASHQLFSLCPVQCIKGWLTARLCVVLGV